MINENGARLIEELTTLCGLAREFINAAGERVEIDLRQRCSLLAALGIDVGSEEQLRCARDEMLRRQRRTLLDDVLVVEESQQPIKVRVQIPIHLIDRHWRCTIQLEGGLSFSGTLLLEEPVEEWEFDGVWYRAFEITLPDFFPPGYHSIEVAIQGDSSEGKRMPIIVAPTTAYQSEKLRQSSFYGLALQLYALHHEDDLGIGDLGHLRRIINWASERQISMIGVSPLHILFPANPAHRSPYSPSSRLYANVMAIEIESIAEFGESSQAQNLRSSEQFEMKRRELKSQSVIDYNAVWELRRPLLEALFATFMANHHGRHDERDRAFQSYLDHEGEALFRQALYDALHERFLLADGLYEWRQWPQEYRDPSSNAVLSYARHNYERVLFFQYLQWQFSEQITRLRQEATSAGIALYLDLAVGVHPGGAEVWSDPDLYGLTATVGAPADSFSPLGQDWGLAPMQPHELRRRAYAPFIDMLRHNMLEDGILRMDHIMALFRLWWVTGVEDGVKVGGYVHYPARELMSILALESHRRRCLVIGEDLGTVPPEVTEEMLRRKIFSWRVFSFEREGEAFKHPRQYPAGSVATLNTHDLPTFAGWWQGEDIEERQRLGFFHDQGRVEHEWRQREREKGQLLHLLAENSLLAAGESEELLRSPCSDDLLVAIHELLAQSSSKMVLFSIYDLIGEQRQPNMPGTVDEYPSWALRHRLSLEESFRLPQVHRILQIIQRKFHA